MKKSRSFIPISWCFPLITSNYTQISSGPKKPVSRFNGLVSVKTAIMTDFQKCAKNLMVSEGKKNSGSENF